jgi:hypothetical protein
MLELRFGLGDSQGYLSKKQNVAHAANRDWPTFGLTARRRCSKKRSWSLLKRQVTGWREDR